MTTRIIGTFMTAVAIAACAEAPSGPAGGDPLSVQLNNGSFRSPIYVNERRPIAIDARNPCNGESVPLVGEVFVVGHFVGDRSGGQHFDGHMITHADGVGAVTGADYRFNEAYFQVINLSESFPDGSSTTTAVASQVVVSRGGVPNFEFWIMLHATFNPAGELVSVKADFRERCVG